MSTDETTVYTGFWVNWARGQTLGSTLTLSSRGGLYLVAFLALFVRWSGTHLWGILCFAAFRARAKATSRDGLFYDQQAMLRNSGSDSGALWQIAKMGAQWRKTSRHAVPRSLYLALFAGLHLAAFAVAGIFSAKITGTNSEILLRSDQCGTINFTSTISGDTESILTLLRQFQYLRVDAAVSANYIATCFLNTSSTPVNCDSYVRSKPSWTLSEESSCPFADEMCYGAPGTSVPSISVHLDSGPIDSMLDLGINAPPRDRVTLKKLLTCAPLQTDGFSKVLNPHNDSSEMGSNYFGNSSYWPSAFYYGASLWTNTTATWIFNPATLLEASSGARRIEELNTLPYILAPLTDTANSIDGGNFKPIAQLQQDQANLVLLFLAQDPVYIGAVNDPWFGGQDGLDNVTSEVSLGQKTMVTVLGCVESQQFCNDYHPDGPTCAAIQTSDTNTDTWKTQLALNAKQNVTAQRIFTAMGGATLYTIATQLGSNGMLVAKNTLFRAALSLQPNQWELEVENWFGTGLAAIQRRISKYVTGEGFEAADASTVTDYTITLPTADEQWMCENQITHRSDYASFSVLGLCFILVPGLVIIFINLVLVSVVHRLQPGTELNSMRQLEWERTETLELQRQLFEAKGIDIEAVSGNGGQRVYNTAVESPYATKSEAPGGLPLDSLGGKQGLSAHHAEVDESRSTSLFEPVDQGDDIADPINRYSNGWEGHEMTRLGSSSGRYRRLI
ncbi:hypothetical protein B0A55_03344 [Friedmanniomyces simplex]|uniref:Uncharacterized protein n=1 Tax=Friedmanniomyces simplex TaxID=329884 RepID=A0A4U0XKX7_9PEZI|nr:hypothetical protein B0A55_03344 [Friedmanniomyces simplex]